MFGTCKTIKRYAGVRFRGYSDIYFLRMRLFHDATYEVPYLEKYVLSQFNHFDDEIFRIRLIPVGVTRKPVSLNELTAAVKNICSCLFALHDLSYVHCDIRWPNIIECFDKWIIIDCEYACLLTDAESLADRSSRTTVE